MTEKKSILRYEVRGEMSGAIYASVPANVFGHDQRALARSILIQLREESVLVSLWEVGTKELINQSYEEEVLP